MNVALHVLQVSLKDNTEESSESDKLLNVVLNVLQVSLKGQDRGV